MNATVTSALLRSTKEELRRADQGQLFRRYRTRWLIIVLILIAGQNSWFTEAVTQGKMLEHIRDGYYQSTVYLQLLTLAIYVITFGLTIGRMRYILRVMRKQKTFLCLACLAIMSVLWSQSPMATGRHLPMLISLIALGWYVGLYYTAEEQIRLTLIVGVILLVASTLLALLMPQYGLDTGGEWKGVMGTKNQFGHAILFLFSGLLFYKGMKYRWLWMSSGLLALVALVMARSAESLVLLALLMAIRYWGPLLQKRRKEKLPFLIYIPALGFIVLMVGQTTLLALLGKDATLTGRTDEWAAILPYAMNHKFLGYGYQAFWTGTGDSLNVMRQIGGWMHGADSGYIDIILQFGVVGLMIALSILLESGRIALRLLGRNRNPLLISWYLALVCISLVGNVVDGYFPLTGGAPEIMLVVSCVSLWKLSRVDADEKQPLTEML